MQVGRKLLAKTWASALEHASLPAEECVVFLVKATMPDGTAEAGYHLPGLPDVPHAYLRPAIFRWIDPEIFVAYGERHRVAVWSSLPRAPYSLLGPLLRHELEHASQWARFGTTFFMLDGYLRDAADRGDLDYFAIPSEREANAAAAEFLATQPEHNIAALRKARRFRHLVEKGEPVTPEILDETVAAVREQGDKVLPQLDSARRTTEIDQLESSARNWPAIDMLTPDREQPDLVVVKAYDWRSLLDDEGAGA